MIKRIINKLKRMYFNHLSPREKAEYLRDKVYHMGNNVQLFTNGIGTEPYLISIGDNVNVAAGVSFINHDVSIFNVGRLVDPSAEQPLDKVGSIKLDDNCMIGAHSILMPGCSVGKNSIIAAGSVVTKAVPDNEVWGGHPAKFIMTTEEYKNKLIQLNKTYPWMKDGKMIVPQGSKELIEMRKEFFFGENESNEG